MRGHSGLRTYDLQASHRQLCIRQVSDHAQQFLPLPGSLSAPQLHFKLLCEESTPGIVSWVVLCLPLSQAAAQGQVSLSA